MKWKNRGHEYDEIGKQFENQKMIYIYGAGEIGEEVYSHLDFINCIKGFIDNDVKKQSSGYLGKPVESIVEFMKREVDQYIVIVAASQVNSPIFMKELIELGYVEGRDCFLWGMFYEEYLPIYVAYGWDKLYFSSMSFLPTTQCNLNCAACLSFTPYNNNKRHREIELLKVDLDLYFQWVDYTGLFHISGGEPLLYPKIAELIDYIGYNYRDKIRELTFTTNGTILPSNKLCDAIKKYDIKVIVNDYTDKVGQIKKNKSIVNLLMEKEIKYMINKVETWIDLKPLSTDNSHMDEQMLETYYKACDVPYSSLREGRISSCNYSDYASVAGIIKDVDEDYYLLKPFDDQKKRELMEFQLGYSQRGYVSMCKQCAGFIAINKNIIPVAEQMKRAGE